MQIVINIPDEMWEGRIKEGYVPLGISKYLRNGTLLPKRHGNLIDVDELLASERPKGITDDIWKESHIYKLLSNAPTIIEASTERGKEE